MPQEMRYDALSLNTIEKDLSGSFALVRTVAPSARLVHCMELGQSVLVSYHLRSRHLQAREHATPRNVCSKGGNEYILWIISLSMLSIDQSISSVNPYSVDVIVAIMP